MSDSALVVIPARANSSRLPRKPLARIAGAPMIVHVWRRAVAANLGPVIVATDDDEIAAVVETVGGRTQMVTDLCHSGSDRVAKAVAAIDPGKSFDVIINVQGDEPQIEPAVIRAAYDLMTDQAVDLGTVACPLIEPADRVDPACVKLIATKIAPNRLRAHYFTRSVLYGEGENFRHVGLYAWRRAALEKFTQLAPSPLERREKLEQLRILENFMRVDAVLAHDCARGVDTPEDLSRIRARMEDKERK